MWFSIHLYSISLRRSTIASKVATNAVTYYSFIFVNVSNLIWKQIRAYLYLLQILCDADARVRRFHAMKTRWGIPKFIQVETCSNHLNGYLIDGTCVFGAEVFVVKNDIQRQCFSLMNQPATYRLTREVKHFSGLLDEKFKTESFGCYNWYTSHNPMLSFYWYMEQCKSWQNLY